MPFTEGFDPTLFPVDQPHDTYYPVACVKQPLTGKTRRGSGRDYVIDHHDLGAVGLSVLDVVSRTMFFAFFTNDTPVYHRVAALCR